jgi:ryanodine receptor 2
MSYIPNPIDTSDVNLPVEILELCEKLAQNTHEVWAKGRVEQGWVYGKERNDEKKQTPCMVPYEELSESEKDYDRNTAIETLKLIVKLGYKIVKEQENEQPK